MRAVESFAPPTAVGTTSLIALEGNESLAYADENIHSESDKAATTATMFFMFFPFGNTNIGTISFR
jgi:hypothetical protein